MKYFSGFMDPWTMNMYRYGTAALCYIPFLVYFKRKGLLTRRIFILSLFPTVVNSIAQVLWAMSVFYLESGFIAMFIQTSVIWSTAASFLFFKDERPLMKIPGFWIGTLLTFGSFIGLSVTELDLAKSSSVTGLIIILACSIFWGLYPVSVKMNMKGVDSRLSFGLICTNTAAVLIVGGCLKGNPGIIMSLSAKTFSLLILSAVAGIAVSHVAYYHALTSIGVVVTINITMATPFYTLVLSSIFLKEKITLAKLLFGLGIIAGIFLITFVRHRTFRDQKTDSCAVSG
jgi:drug/metabolite transporter (DMT)-like permease